MTIAPVPDPDGVPDLDNPEGEPVEPVGPQTTTPDEDA